MKQESSNSLPRTRHHENQSESPSPIDVIDEVDNIFKPTYVTYEQECIPVGCVPAAR